MSRVHPPPRSRLAPEFDHAATNLLLSIDVFIAHTTTDDPQPRQQLSRHLQALRPSLHEALDQYNALVEP